MKLNYKKYHLWLLISSSLLTLTACNGGSNNGSSSSETQSLFKCVADGNDACGCLVQNDGSAKPLVWYGHSLTLDSKNNGYSFPDERTVISNFNSGEGHCGYTDWRIPTLSTTDNGDYHFGSSNNKIDKATDFGKLGTYAIANGYKSREDLAIWLNSKGFSLTTDCDNIGKTCIFWSSSTFHSDIPNDAWDLVMNTGLVANGYQYNLYHLLPVRGGN